MSTFMVTLTQGLATNVNRFEMPFRVCLKQEEISLTYVSGVKIVKSPLFPIFGPAHS